jgi:hypothetical protein
MELDLQSLFRLHVHCAQLYSLAETMEEHGATIRIEPLPSLAC